MIRVPARKITPVSSTKTTVSNQPSSDGPTCNSAPPQCANHQRHRHAGVPQSTTSSSRRSTGRRRHVRTARQNTAPPESAAAGCVRWRGMKHIVAQEQHQLSMCQRCQKSWMLVDRNGALKIEGQLTPNSMPEGRDRDVRRSGKVLLDLETEAERQPGFAVRHPTELGVRKDRIEQRPMRSPSTIFSNRPITIKVIPTQNWRCQPGAYTWRPNWCMTSDHRAKVLRSPAEKTRCRARSGQADRQAPCHAANRPDT